MTSRDDQTSEMRKLIPVVMNKLDEDIREISYHQLMSIQKREFGVKCPISDIRGIFWDGRYVQSIGWGRGEGYLHRIPPDFNRIENMI
jgi:hypothetical protein